MIVKVGLNASLRRYIPSGAGESPFSLELEDGARVSDVLSALGIPPEYAKIIVSGDEQLDAEAVLRDGQEVGFFPPMAGG